jgi:hypothetical protein
LFVWFIPFGSEASYHIIFCCQRDFDKFFSNAQFAVYSLAIHKKMKYSCLSEGKHENPN